MTRRWLIGMAALQILGTHPAAATTLEDYAAQVFDSSNAADKPILLLSKGSLLAWLPDPINFRGGRDPGWFYKSGDRSMLIVPPGDFLIVFPPRASPAAGGDAGGRVQNKQYQLAVTKEGLWGIFDYRNSSLFLTEFDLRRYSVSDGPAGADPGVAVAYGMASATTSDLSYRSATLTRGDTFRILAENPDGTTTIDFAGAIPAIAGKRAQLEALAKATGTELPSSFKVKTSAIVAINLQEVIDDAVLEEWRQGHAVALDHKTNVFSHFGNVRVPGHTSLRFGCGDPLTVSTTSKTSASVDVTADVKGQGGFWHWFSASMSLSADAKASSEQIKTNLFTEKSVTRRTLFPVEYRAPDGEDGFFYAGIAQTCQSSPAWYTLVVRKNDKDDTLHREFAELGPDGKEPLHFQDPTQPKLEAIKVGGNPFDIFRGSVRPRCFRQEMQFEDIVKEEMPDRLEARVAIALATFPQLGTVDLRAFFSDESCNAAPAESPLTQ